MIPFSAGVSPPPQTALLCRQPSAKPRARSSARSEEHTSELQSQSNLVCRLLLEKKNNIHHLDRGFISQSRDSPGHCRLYFNQRLSPLPQLILNSKTYTIHTRSRQIVVSYRLCI